MNLGNWQRDLLRIMLYAAGAVIAFLGIPTFFVAYATVIQAMSTASKSPIPLGDRMGGLCWVLVLQPTLQIAAGVLLARWSAWFARVVFPDHPEPRDAA